MKIKDKPEVHENNNTKQNIFTRTKNYLMDKKEKLILLFMLIGVTGLIVSLTI